MLKHLKNASWFWEEGEVAAGEGSTDVGLLGNVGVLRDGETGGLVRKFGMTFPRFISGITLG
jgi:hypothetical protein